jgi:hypothetical protein
MWKIPQLERMAKSRYVSKREGDRRLSCRHQEKKRLPEVCTIDPQIGRRWSGY